MKKSLGMVFLLVGGLTAGAPAQAVNLLTNPNFDGTLDPWSTFLQAPTVFDADHSATADGTGSALVTIPDSEKGQNLALAQCVAVVPGTAYAFGGKVRISSASGAAGSAFAFLDWHTASDCSTGSRIGTVRTTSTLDLPPGPTDVWITVQGVAMAPSGATHARMLPAVEITGPLPVAASGIRPEAAVQNLIVSIDDLFVTPITTTVPTLGAVGLAALFVSLAAAAIVLIRR